MTTASLIKSGAIVRVSLAHAEPVQGRTIHADTLGLALNLSGVTVFYPWYSITDVTVIR